jgi:hypothetical protein
MPSPQFQVLINDCVQQLLLRRAQSQHGAAQAVCASAYAIDDQMIKVSYKLDLRTSNVMSDATHEQYSKVSEHRLL